MDLLHQRSMLCACAWALQLAESTQAIKHSLDLLAYSLQV